MGETMRSLLDGEARRAARRSCARTGSTSREDDHGPRHRVAARPGRAALLRALRENGEREVRLVGTDMSERAVGRHLCDAFHLVPAGLRPRLRGRDSRARRARGRRRRPAAVVVRPRGLAAHRDRFPVSRCSSRRRRRSTARTTRRRPTRCCSGSACRRPSSAASAARAEVEAAARRARLPGPARLLQAGLLLRLARLPHPRPDRRPRAPAPARAARLGGDAARGGGRAAAGRGRTELLVMELATGGERTIDGIADGREIVLGHPKTREAMRAGLAMYFVTLDDPELMELADAIVARARDRVVLQHPARRRARDRDQPAHLDDRLPGGPEPARTSASSARSARSPTSELGGAAQRESARAERRCATSTRSSSTGPVVDSPRDARG